MAPIEITPLPRDRPLLRYGFALLLSTGALALSLALRQQIQQSVFIFFLMAVILISAYCGLGPALLATVFGVLSANFLLLPPHFSSLTDPILLLRTVLFCLLAFLISGLSEARLRAHRREDESEQRFRVMADVAPVMIWTTGADKMFGYFNRSWLEFRGRAMAQEVGHQWADGVHPEDRPRYLDAFAAAFERREAFRVEGRLQRHDGQYRWMLAAGVPRYLPNGEFIGYIGSSIDITERKEAEVVLQKQFETQAQHVELAKSALFETRERFRLLIEETRDYAIFIIDPSGRITSWNVGAERIKGYTAEEIIGKEFSIFYTPEDLRQDLPKRLLEEAARLGRIEHEGWRVRKDGTRFWANIIITALHDDQGQIKGFGKITRDMTLPRKAAEELRKKDQELFQSRKLEAVGRLAGGVAHDFNNLLTGIVGISQDLRGTLPMGDPRADELLEIVKAADRAGALTRQLLAFGRRQIAAPQVVKINEVLSEMDKILRRLIGEDIELINMLDPAAGHIRVDPGQLEQVVINLVLNSRDAMPNGGKITIETLNVELTDEYSKRHFEVIPGSYVMLAISDNGTGMDPEVQTHAFEPFFTTKEKDKGSGLGLATVYGIVKQNGGDIFLYSNPAAGTTFKIYLPRVDAAKSPERRNALRIEPPKGNETVLLVEDEPIVRRVAAKALHKCGYSVLEASNGKEALEISASYHKPIHLLLTDVVMPGMNGRQLAEMLSSNRPEMKILYMSGYTENVIVHRGILEPGIAFLEKSFTSETLCRRVREVLDAKAIERGPKA